NDRLFSLALLLALRCRRRRRRLRGLLAAATTAAVAWLVALRARAGHVADDHHVEVAAHQRLEFRRRDICPIGDPFAFAPLAVADGAYSALDVHESGALLSPVAHEHACQRRRLLQVDGLEQQEFR